MKPLLREIVAMAVLAFTILLAGCITAETPIPSAGAPVTTPAITPATVAHTIAVTQVPAKPGCAYPPLNPWTWVPESYSPAGSGTTKIPPAPGTLISKADLFGTPSLQWEEYDYTSQTRDSPLYLGSIRKEMSRELHKGKPALHENFTYVVHSSGAPPALWDMTIDDMYYDDYGNMLSMHRRVIRDGNFLENTDHPPVNTNRGTPDCSGEVFTPRYTFIGTDPVTVPAGAYPGAMKYVAYNGDDKSGKTAGITYWFASGIPVPVRWMIEDPEEGRSSTYELKGWG